MNDNGEYEFVLRNRQLFNVFFVAAVLLGGFVTIGYIAGRNSVLVRAVVPKTTGKPLMVDSISPPERKPGPAGDALPLRETARLNPADGLPLPATPKELKTESAPKQKPGNSEAGKEFERKAEANVERSEQVESEEAGAESSDQPSAGQSYLQLKATSKSEADAMVNGLRQKGFPSLTVEIQEKPGVWRVLVGPVREGGANALRADLLKDGFPGDVAIRRTY